MRYGIARRSLVLAVIRGVAAATVMGLPLSAAATPMTARQLDWSATPLRLMMVEAKGCVYCEAWHREIGPGYRASSEGRAAPLLRVDIDGPWPDGLALDRRPTITPTFVLLRDGAEVTRLEGYPGARVFHSLIGAMLANSGARTPGG